MAAVSLVLSGVNAGLNILGGQYAERANRYAAEATGFQADLAERESQAEAERYAAKARAFKAEQKVAYLKSGVTLEGSPLDVLDETARVASENISAIRAQGAAKASELRSRASQLRMAGRAALVAGYQQAASGISSTAMMLAMGNRSTSSPSQPTSREWAGGRMATSEPYRYSMSRPGANVSRLDLGF